MLLGSKNEKTVTEGLRVMKKMLSHEAFFKRGERGPVLFMTDDDDALRNALKTVWPEALCILCVWHILQSTYRWLCNGNNGIHKDHRQELLRIFKDMMYAETGEDFEEQFLNDFLDHPLIEQYSHYLEYLESQYFNRIEAWALFYRKENMLPTHNTNTNNYVEISFRETKDHQFNRQKAFNLPELLSIVMDQSENYVQKLIDMGCSRTDQLRYNHSRYNMIPSKIECRHIIDLGEGDYLVESEKSDKQYKVSMLSGFCQCPAGSNCGPCKHKSAIAKFFGFAGFNAIPTNDPHMRALWHYIAVGQAQSAHMYRDDKDSDKNLDIEGFIESRLMEKNIQSEDDQNCRLDHESDPEILPDENNEEYALEEKNEEEIANFLELWSEYGKSVADAMRKEPNDKLWKDCMKKVKNKISNSKSYRPQTLRHHLYSFGQDGQGPKDPETGRRSLLIPVQPAALARSRAQGTKRRGTQALGTTGNFKDRSGETERLAHQSLFFDQFISCPPTLIIHKQMNAILRKIGSYHNFQQTHFRRKCVLYRNFFRIKFFFFFNFFFN